MENKTDYAAGLKNAEISLLPKYITLIYTGVFCNAFAYVRVGCLKVTYIKNRKSYEKSLLDIKCVFHSPLWLLFDTFFTSINIQQVLLRIYAEIE
jgi:hypothetical protein